MPKVDAKSEAQTCLKLTTQADIKAQTMALLVGDKGKALRELEISFSTADNSGESRRGALIAGLLKRTPDLIKLTLNFSGPLNTHSDCLGEPLTNALCDLKDLEVFHQGRMTAVRTDLGQYTLTKLVTSWPKLRVLYVAGDINGYEDDYMNLPPATCALENVTFERCLANYENLALLFAGSSQSLKKFEAWTMGHGKTDAIFAPVLPSIQSITIGGCDHPTPSFILDHLSSAPHLSFISFGGNDDCTGEVRKALTEALNLPGSFPSLTHISYPGQSGTYKTGRGRNARTHEYENSGAKELEAAARARNIRVDMASDLEYKVEGAQRRAGFAAMARRGW